MATSGSKRINVVNSGNIYLLFNWSASAPNIANNYTPIYWELKLVSASSSANINSTAPKDYSVTVDGQTWSGTNTVGISGGSSKILASGSKNIYHNVDGSKTFTYSFSQEIAINYSGSWVGTRSGDGTGTLDNIPRHATLTAAPNFTDEENPTINYSNPAGDAITSIQACIANASGTVAYADYRDIPKNGSSYTFELTDEEREALRNATLTSNTDTIAFYLSSVIDGTTKTVYLHKTLTIVNTMPELTVSAKDVGAASIALTGDENKIIKGFNYVLSSMSSKLKKGATIKSQTITNGSQSLIGEAGGTASMEGGFNNVESNTFTFGLTDSRGNTVNKYLTLDMVDYVKLTCNLTVEKPTVDGNMNFNVSGNYFNDTFGAQYNYLALEYRIKKEGEDWSNWSLISDEYTLQDNKYSVDASISGLDYRKAYTIQVRAQDRINLIPSAERTVKAMPVYDWGANDFNFNVPVTFEGKSLIDLIYPVGSIYMAVNYFDPATIFGGEWERIMDKFLLGSGAIYVSGQEGGEATHTLTVSEMPSHNHGYVDQSGNVDLNGWFGRQGSYVDDAYMGVSNSIVSYNSASFQMSHTGGGEPHNNMPPYLTVNIWKRIA